MVTVEEVRSDADLEAWRHVHIAVLPHERADTVEQIAQTGVQSACYSSRGNMATWWARRQIQPDRSRIRRGIGTVLLRELNTHAVTLGFPVAVANADDEGSAAFAERFGFHEIDRHIEQARTVGDEVHPPCLTV